MSMFQRDCVLLVGMGKNHQTWHTTSLLSHLCRQTTASSVQTITMQTRRETANNPPQQKLWSFWFLTWGGGGQQPIPQLHPPHLPHPVPPLLLTLHWPPTQPPASSGNPHFVCVYHRSFHYFDQNHHCGHGFQVQHTWKESEVWISVTKPLILAFPEASRSHLARKVSRLHQHRYTLLSQDIQSLTKVCKSPLTRCAVISFYNPFREPVTRLYFTFLFSSIISLPHQPGSNGFF